MKKPRNTLLSICRVSVLSLVILAMVNCGGEDEKPNGSGGIIIPVTDTTSPGAVTDLRLSAPTSGSFAVVWTAPGDDGMTGTATEYDIRYSKSPIADGNWEAATQVDKKRVTQPKPCGQIETIVVIGLSSNTSYFFALKTSDEVSNWSPLSNCATSVTLREVIPPARVTDLEAFTVDNESFLLTWTAPGDDGTTGTAVMYDIRYSETPIGNEAGWEVATPVGDVAPPKPSGGLDSVTVSGVAFQKTLFFALKTVDDSQNQSGISNNAGGLADGETFWLGPKNVYRGENVYLLFRTDTPDILTITVNGQYVPHICNLGVFEEITSASFEDGVHLVEYDFFRESVGTYFGESQWRIAVCKDDVYLGQDWVNFMH